MSIVPSTQPAAVYRQKGVLEVEDRPVRTLEPDEVLVEVSHCGICGTDLHQVLDGWGIPDSVGGHEFSGTVAATGGAVERWGIGDRVVGGPELACGHCRPCRAGRPALCENQPTPGVEAFDGAFTSFVPIHEGRLVGIPDRLDLRDAALAEPGTRRAELARQLGAGAVLDPSDLDVPAVVVEPNRIIGDSVDVVIETSGRRDAIEAGIGQLDKGGRIVLVGTGLDAPTLDPIRVLLNELVITGAFTYDADGFERALELLASGELPVELLADPHDVGLSGMIDAMRRLVAGEIAGKVLVVPNTADSPSKEAP